MSTVAFRLPGRGREPLRRTLSLFPHIGSGIGRSRGPWAQSARTRRAAYVPEPQIADANRSRSPDQQPMQPYSQTRALPSATQNPNRGAQSVLLTPGQVSRGEV